MNRTDHLERLRELCSGAERVLDVGGAGAPCTWATHQIDLLSYDEAVALDWQKGSWGDGELRCVRENHLQFDICDRPWPYEDDFFDFVVASHVLEDIRDPLGVVREMSRVGKAGYVEMPSRLRESFAKTRFFRLRRALGRIPDIGYDHHRWFVEAEGSHLRFTPKSFLIMTRSEFHFSRTEFPNKFSREQGSTAVFWEKELTAEEVVIIDRSEREDELRHFKARSLAELGPKVGKRGA